LFCQHSVYGYEPRRECEKNSKITIVFIFCYTPMYLISYKKINHSEKLLNSDVDLLLRNMGYGTRWMYQESSHAQRVQSKCKTEGFSAFL